MSFKEAIAKINEKAKPYEEVINTVVGSNKWKLDYIATKDENFRIHWVKLSDVLAVVTGLQRQLREKYAFYKLEPWGTCEYQEDMVKFLENFLGITEKEKRVFGEQKE